MCVSTFQASLAGQVKIKQAREEKGWTVREEDYTPLKEASKFLIRQHGAANEWGANDPQWLKDFARLFRVEKHRTIDEIKTRILRTRQGSLLERIEQLIETGEIFAKDISYGSWNRFASQKKLHRIKVRPFKAYCQVLGLNWEEIIDCTCNERSHNTEAITNPPPVQTSANGTLSKRPYHNLPVRYHTALIGRDREMMQLMELLSPDVPTPHISIEGMGGAGKTSLVLETAYRCVLSSSGTPATNVSLFDAIIFTSAKQQHLIGNHILQRHRRERTLNDIYRAIFRTLECPGTLPADSEQQLECIQNRLQELYTLLIVDNLETLEDQKNVLSFLYELPPTVKVVITTRFRAAFGRPIYLESLPFDEAMRLIEHQALEQQLQLEPEQSQAIYNRTSGLPLGIVYAIGQLSVYGISSEVLESRLTRENDLARYCFEDSMQWLRGQLAHQLLMGLALFAKSASRDAISQISLPQEVNPKSRALFKLGGNLPAGLRPASLTRPTIQNPKSLDSFDALSQLHQLRLVIQRGKRWDMHPLTREYALAELNAHPEFEQQARERWVNWYLQFSQPYQQEDWKQWNEYQDLDQEWENLQAVIEWCIQQNRYDNVKQFWQNVKGYTYVQGYWHERLSWIEWLLQEAQQHQDKSMMVEALVDKGWTLNLMLMGKPEQLAEVDALFEQASNLQEGEDPILQLELAIERAVLSIHQRKCDRACQLLAWATELLDGVELEEPRRLRQQIRIDYYQAEIWFTTENYERAKTLYERALEQARVVQYQQVEVYTLNWLAEIALLGEGDLDEAERLLKLSMPIALKRKDKISIAFHKRSWAHLQKLKGNLTQFQHWAMEAKQEFESLGMLAEAQEIQSWLEDNLVI
jgi:hypothetical protein